MYNANYMDGVPVKIAEKYKPPRDAYKLPQSLATKLNIEDKFYWNCPTFSYNFELEKKGLVKIEQWKRIRQRNKEDRKERNLKREQQRKQEYEDTQKNLLYSVTYPSTDDLSSEDDTDIDPKKNCVEISKPAPQICAGDTMHSFHNILQPTVLPLNNSSTSKNSQTLLITSAYDNKISNSFNYKDFEDDTSSPFDNIELKTINDLDVLAQVLHNTQIGSRSDEQLNKNVAVISNDNSKDNTSCNYRDDAHIAEESIPNHTYNVSNSYSELNSHETLATSRDNFVAASLIHEKTNLPHSSLAPVSYLNGCCYELNKTNNKVDSDILKPYDRQEELKDDQIKSKSVPNILKELKTEIRKSEMRRFKNCSCNIKETLNNDPAMLNKPMVKTNDKEEDTFLLLDSKAKQLVKQITAMGFPSKRVSRIVQLLGADDKKVVEHLIHLSELADLGFEESKISDALIRNEHNKNKTLDDLIS